MEGTEKERQKKVCVFCCVFVVCWWERECVREERLWRVAARSRQGHQLDPCPCLSFLAHIQGAMEPGSQGLFPNPNEPSPRSRFHPCMRSSLQAAHPRPSWTIISRP